MSSNDESDIAAAKKLFLKHMQGLVENSLKIYTPGKKK